MPVEFLQQEPSGGSSHATRLVMMYDGSGRRISKTAMRMVGDDDWDTTLVTHYTGIGTEIREYKPRNFVRYTDSAGVEHCVSANPDYGGNASTACPLPDTVKAVIPLPQGLGRYALQDVGQVDENGAPQAFEWYLKNHLGSTMVVYGTGFPDPLGISPEGELRAAYDYRSFGEQLDLLVFTRKVTENFTGKELDDETQLDYFGARYLDPMLGMWISVDPARQFASPYLYAGNGMNPVIGVDPDGNEVEIKNEQTTMLGMINQASYNQYELDGNTLVEGSTCYEKGNAYFSERMDAAIYSDNLITVEMDPTNTDAINGGEGVTYMTGDYGMSGANARIVITGRSYGKSSAAQNAVHEFVSHAIPFILGDRPQGGSALEEEYRAIKGVFPIPEGVDEHPIYK